MKPLTKRHKKLKSTKKVKNTKKMIVPIIIVAAITIYLLYILTPLGNIQLLAANKKELAEKIEQDFKRLELYMTGMKDTMSQIEANSDIFQAKNLNDINPEEKELLLQSWADYLDYQVALSKITEDYKYFYQINYFFNRELHTKAFLLSYASFITSYANGANLINYTINKTLFENLLNDKDLKNGISSGMYDKLKWNVIHVNDVVRLTAGYGNYKFLYSKFEKLGLTKEKPEIFSDIEEYYKSSTKNLEKKAVIWFPTNGIDIFKKQTYKIWFPLQKNVAKQMGKTRVTTRHKNFITKDQILTMKKEMEPGDLLVERKNWYTSNIGIPGFWPHAAFYLGNKDELVKYFETPEILEYIKETNVQTIEEAITQASPSFYEKFKNNEFDVIEAIAEGVVLTPLTESANADYVGVLRPNLSKLEKFKAVISTIKHYKKPYDFHFDFITDSEIVCSELTYKAYRSVMNIPLTEHVGRLIVPATEFVKKFDREYNKPNPELSFVYFLDGREKTQKAFVGDVESFRKTWERPKWDILQE